MERFDSWGVDYKRFPGVSKFKEGFGGEKLVYPQGFDIPLKKIPYCGYKTVSKLKRNV